MVPKWILKAVVQKTISFMPYKHKINYFFQKYVTKGVFLTDEYFEDRLTHAGNHLKYYKKYANNTPLKTTLELGTGWYPVVPISLFLNGAQNIYTLDISTLSNKDHVLTTIEKFCDYHDRGKLNQYIDIIPSRMDVLKSLLKDSAALSLEDLTRRLYLHYLVQDARHITLENQVIDLIHSNNTFEHIFPEILESILIEFKRISNPGGIQSHFVDMSDHFAHYDQSINIYNYLQFSDKQWQVIDNDIQPQNRWRINDYKALYQKVGITISDVDYRKGSLEKLQTIDLAEKYKDYPPQDLAVSHCHIISKTA